MCQADGDHHQRNKLRLAQPEGDALVHADELDGETRETLEDQIEAKEPSLGRLFADRPHQGEDRGVEERFVNRRRMHEDAGKKSRDEMAVAVEFEHRASVPADDCVGVGHRPRQRRGQAPVAVAGEEASDAPKGLAQDEGRGARVESIAEPAPCNSERRGRRR